MLGVLSYLLEAHNKAQILARRKRYNFFQNDFNWKCCDVELGLKQFVECPLLLCHFVLGLHHSKLREWAPMDGNYGLWWSRVFFFVFLWYGFVCWYLCKGTRLLKSLTLGVSVWTCIFNYGKKWEPCNWFQKCTTRRSAIYGKIANGVRHKIKYHSFACWARETIYVCVKLTIYTVWSGG